MRNWWDAYDLLLTDIDEKNKKEMMLAMELKRQYGEELKCEQFTCPDCGGRLITRMGPYGDFFGCSNYSTKGCKYKRKL